MDRLQINSICSTYIKEEKHYQQQLGYGLVQRLIRDQGSYGEQQLDYDAVGNRLSQTQTNATDSEPQREEYHYAPASNRLLGTPCTLQQVSRIVVLRLLS